MPEVRTTNGFYDGDDDDLVAVEKMNPRDFNDAWADIQHKTFRNWINNQLKDKSPWRVEDLSTDFQDGCVLCRLLEILSEKSLGR